MTDLSSRLDDQELIASLDPSRIFQLTVEFPAQCRLAIELGEEADLSNLRGHFHKVILAGMGGSAAAGDYIQAIVDRKGTCPFTISRDYGIPQWARSDTLVICSSYSGNTEETLASYLQAKRQGSSALCVTTGGKLGEYAQANGDALITIPAGQPPRTALGYMLFAPLTCLFRLGLLDLKPEQALPEFLAGLVERWRPSVPLELNRAKKLALELHGKTPVIYGLGGWQGAVAKRWKAQVNENAKVPAFANAFPELNHNEILGWKGVQRPGEWAIVSLEDGGETAKMQARRQFTFDQFREISSHRVLAEGSTWLEKILCISLFGDFVSVYMSVLLGVDPGDISMLERLKVELAQVGE